MKVTPQRAVEEVIKHNGCISEAAQDLNITYVHLWQRYKEGRNLLGIKCPICGDLLKYKGKNGDTVEWECRKCSIIAEDEKE